MIKGSVRLILCAIIVLFLFGCGPAGYTPQPVTPTQKTEVSIPQLALNIVASSEIKPLADTGIFADFARSYSRPISVTVSYKEAVDIKNQLIAKDTKSVNIFWPSSSVWLPAGFYKESNVVMKTLLVLAVNAGTAQSLGWNKAELGINDLTAAVSAGKISLAMSSATQSNAGAVFYLAMLSALKGNNTAIQSADLQNPKIQSSVKSILSSVNRGAQSTSDLRDLFVNEQLTVAPKLNAAILYESLAIGANQTLVSKGKQPLKIYYVQNAVAIADAPLAYIDNGDSAKYDAYKALIAFLRTPDVQKKIQALGWRVANIGMTIDNPDPAVFNPAWGIIANADYGLVPIPKDAIIDQALSLYQSFFRKASWTAICADTSGSMDTNTGLIKVKEAVDMLLDQGRASQLGLQATQDDVYDLRIFGNDRVSMVGTVKGNDPGALKFLSNSFRSVAAGGNTPMFACIEAVYDTIGQNYDPNRYLYSVIAMTDGDTNSGPDLNHFQNYFKTNFIVKERTAPLFGITFGDVKADRLQAAASTTKGLVYSGVTDLVKAFRLAKGNN